MKDATFAPMYACIYPGLCDVARRHGYALAVHGTLARDVDLIAVPWTEEAKPDEELVAALKAHLGAVYLHEKMAPFLPPGHEVAGYEGRDPTAKPHGRKAWSLYLDHGAYFDVSVMPRTTTPQG